MDDAFVREIDHEARRQRIDRSKLIRKAVAKYIADARRQVLEAQHRAGYVRHPQRHSDVVRWERVQQWPKE